MARRLRVPAALLALLVAWSATAPAACAHPGDEPGSPVGAVSALPAPRATITDELRRVSVTFGAPVAELAGHELLVTGPDGGRVDVGPVSRADARTLSVGLRQLSEQGVYDVAFVALLQGHRAEGGYRFAYTGPVREGRPPWALAAGTSLLALAAAGAWVLRRRRADSPASPARACRDVAAGPSSDQVEDPSGHRPRPWHALEP